MASGLPPLLVLAVLIRTGRCVLAPAGKKAPAAFQPRVPPPEDRKYYAFQCSTPVLIALRAEAAVSPGVVISGQGGSATRAAQEVVELVGTHDFGHLDAATKDSWAVRVPFQRLFERSLPDARAAIIKDTGTAEYNVTDVGPALHGKMSSGVCAALTILDDMRARAPARRPWGVKEPFLRFMLPFFGEALGGRGFLFVHVTRDIRSIHKVHGDEELFAAIDDAEQLINNFVNTAAHPSAVMLMSTPSAMLLRAMNNSFALYEHFGTELGCTMESIQQYLKFAFVWGHIELGIHRAWTHKRPDRYFHLSELKMASDGASTARRLAKFLGGTTLTDSQIDAMKSVYRPQEDTRTAHWALMQGIVKLGGMQVARDALEAFGYTL